MTRTIELPKKLLLAVDSQGMCEHALHACLWLARVLPAEVECLHAFPPRPILWGKSSQAAEWEAGTDVTRRGLARMLQDFVRRAPVELRPLAALDPDRLAVHSGHSASLVVERARSGAADLVLLGPHRTRRGMDFGNTARGVLAKAHCPVWLQPAPARPIQRILVPTDLSPHADHALAYARRLAQRLDARVTVLHVFEPPVLGAAETLVPGPTYAVEDLKREAVRSFEEHVQRLELDSSGVVREFLIGNTVDTILGLQARHDLVVMGTHGHTGFAAALLGSVTYSVARSIRTALLAVPHPGREFLQ